MCNNFNNNKQIKKKLMNYFNLIEICKILLRNSNTSNNSHNNNKIFNYLKKNISMKIILIMQIMKMILEEDLIWNNLIKVNLQRLQVLKMKEVSYIILLIFKKYCLITFII